MTQPELIMIVRICVAFFLGGAVGLQRELSREPAGLRTHMLVAAGSACFMALSVLGFDALGGGGHISSDRIAAQIVTGVGFLGAGTIWRTQATVRGLTTAASIWMAAAIGMLSAAGYYALAGTAAALTIVALSLIGLGEQRLVRQKRDSSDQPPS